MSKVVAISCGQRSSFPRADAVWFSDGRTFVSDNDLGKMWEFRIKRTADRVESAIKSLRTFRKRYAVCGYGQQSNDCR